MHACLHFHLWMCICVFVWMCQLHLDSCTSQAVVFFCIIIVQKFSTVHSFVLRSIAPFSIRFVDFRRTIKRIETMQFRSKKEESEEKPTRKLEPKRKEKPTKKHYLDSMYTNIYVLRDGCMVWYGMRSKEFWLHRPHRSAKPIFKSAPNANKAFHLQVWARSWKAIKCKNPANKTTTEKENATPKLAKSRKSRKRKRERKYSIKLVEFYAKLFAIYATYCIPYVESCAHYHKNYST